MTTTHNQEGFGVGLPNIRPNEHGIIEIPEYTQLMARDDGQEIPNTFATLCDDTNETACNYPECHCFVFVNIAVPGYSVFVSRLPACDICQDGTLAEYDVSLRVFGGTWGNVCGNHFHHFGCTLGVGLGQRLILSKEGE